MDIQAQNHFTTYSSTQEPPHDKVSHIVIAPANPKIVRTTYFKGDKPIQKRGQPFRQPKPKLDPLPKRPYHPYMELQKNNLDIENSATNTLFMSYSHKIDKFIEYVADTSVPEAAEKLFYNYFDAAKCYYWNDVPSLKLLYSPTLRTYTNYSTSLVSHVFDTKEILITDSPLDMNEFDENVDSFFASANCPVIIFPLWDFKNRVVAIISVSRMPDQPMFEDQDENFIAVFQQKFSIFSRWLLNPPIQEPIILDILQLHNLNEMVPALTKRFENFFNCRQCEVWCLDKKKKKIICHNSKTISQEISGSGGVVGKVLENETTLNTHSVHSHPAYNPDFDSPADSKASLHKSKSETNLQLNSKNNFDEAIIAIPVVDINSHYVIATVLRGPYGKPIFSSEDEDCLKKLAPFVALAFLNAKSFSDIQGELIRSGMEREGLAALLEVAEILGGQFDTERLCEIIMEKGRYLTKADRCSLFLVSQTGGHLITQLHRGLKECIDIPISKGIVGRTVKEQKTLNIKDAYEDPTFDNSVDLKNGYRTKSILSVPIINHRGEVIGVTQMINKQNGEAFTKFDTNLMQIFNVFCGVSLENARLFNEWMNMNSQLRLFFGVSLSLSRETDMKRVIIDILKQSRKALDSKRATVFLTDDESDVLTSFVVDGGKIPATIPKDIGIAGYCIKSKSGAIVNDPYSDNRFNSNIDVQTGYKTNSLCASPILSNTGNVLGVIELINTARGIFNEKDLQLLESISSFIALIIENYRYKDIASLRSAETLMFDIGKCISENEKGVPSSNNEIPKHLQLTPDQIEKLNSLDFFAFDWTSNLYFKIVFYFFNKFQLLTTFKISNESLFHFLFTISKNYDNVPYHNWTHAIDVTQFLANQISIANLDEHLKPHEILALFVASICHDLNHNICHNQYKYEKRFSILYKNQNLINSHRCSVVLQIMNKDKCNIFSNLSAEEDVMIWNLIIPIIMSTDPLEHFQLIDQINNLLTTRKFSMENEMHRLLALKLLFKASDTSFSSRPFSISEKWLSKLTDEVSSQQSKGKKSKLSTSDNQEQYEKALKQIGFINFMVLPLFQALERIFSSFDISLNAIKSNLEVWKDVLDSKHESLT